MRVAVAFHNECLELDVPDDRLIAQWQGPAGMSPSETGALVREALEKPRDFPPLRQAVVPGDHVAIACDADIPHPRPVLDAIAQILTKAGVDAASITVVATSERAGDLAASLPPGLTLVVHDPDDRKQLAYLAATSEGRRVYLNRHLVDADCVLPVGRLGYDPVLGYRGPWGVIFPALSDRETLSALRAQPSRVPDRDHPRAALTESAEVCWLLGCQLQLGLVNGIAGPSSIIAGTEAAVRDQGASAVDRAWSFEPESRAELVVVGIGLPGRTAGVEDLAEGLATATRLAQRGGKIVALSRVEGPIGPSARRLIDQAVAWADVYLFSALNAADVDDLSMMPLDRPDQARRLVAVSGSCLVVSQAELTRASVVEEHS